MAIETLEKVEKSKIKNWSVIIRDQTKASSKRPKVTFTIWDFCLQLRNIQLLVFSTSCTNNDLIKKWTFLIIQVYKSQQCRGNRITKHESILSRVFFFFSVVHFRVLTFSGAPNENIVQNHLNKAFLNVYLNGGYGHILSPINFSSVRIS